MEAIEVTLYSSKHIPVQTLHGYHVDPEVILTLGSTNFSIPSVKLGERKKKQVDTHWNQKFVFEVPANILPASKLLIQLMEVEDDGGKIEISRAWIPMNNLKKNTELCEWYPLDSSFHHTIYKPKVRIGMKLLEKHLNISPNAPNNALNVLAVPAPNYMPFNSPNISYRRSVLLPNPVPKPTLTAFNPHQLSRQTYIAKGSFGVIYKGKAEGIPNTIVIKDIEIKSQKSVEEWKKELSMMSNTKSPYVADVYGYTTAANILTIVMEYFPRGDLYAIIHKEPHKHPLSFIQRMRMGRHIAIGLSFVHRCHVMHRDIKSMNVLVTEDYTCKLADFGTAKHLQSDRQFYNTVNSGTPLWMAPEVKRGVYTYSADVYSLGLVLYELFEKKLPFYDQFRQTVVLPPTFQSASVVVPCLNNVPEKRPTVDQVAKVIDNMLNDIIKKVKDNISGPEKEKIKKEVNEAKDEDKSELELSLVYRLLLSKSAHETDALLNKSFNIEPIQHHRLPVGQTQIMAQPIQPGIPYMQQPIYPVQQNNNPMMYRNMVPQGIPMSGYPPGY